MAPFVEPLDAFHDSTDPSDWYEGLIKAYVGDGMATDFYREVSTYVKDEADAGADPGGARRHRSGVVRGRAGEREHPRSTPSVAGRLALWATATRGRGADPGAAGRGRAGRAASSWWSAAAATWPG